MAMKHFCDAKSITPTEICAADTIITRGLKIAVHVATIRQGERQFKEIYIWKFVKHTATLFLVSGDAVRPGHSWLIYYVQIIHGDHNYRS